MLLGLISVAVTCDGGATEAGLWPLPARSSSGAGVIQLSGGLSVVLEGESCAMADFARRRLEEAFSWSAAAGCHVLALLERERESERVSERQCVIASERERRRERKRGRKRGVEGGLCA